MTKRLTISEERAELLADDEPDEEFEFVEEGEWEDDGKYSSNFVVLQHKATGDFYMMNMSRSGSYFTDYDYQYYGDLVEVEKKEVTVSRWVTKK